MHPPAMHSWLSFACAMGSNAAFACRAVFSKLAMGADLGANMSAPNLFGVVSRGRRKFHSPKLKIHRPYLISAMIQQ